MSWLSDTIASTDETGKRVELWMKLMIGFTIATTVLTAIAVFVGIKKK